MKSARRPPGGSGRRAVALPATSRTQGRPNVRDLAGRTQWRPRGRHVAGLRARLVQHAARVVHAAGKLDRVTVVEDLLAAGGAVRVARVARPATQQM